MGTQPPRPVHIHTKTAPWESGAAMGLGDGSQIKTLRVDEATGSVTALTLLTEALCGSPESTLNLFVLQGTGSWNARRLQPGVFASCLAGSAMTIVPDSHLYLYLSFEAESAISQPHRDGREHDHLIVDSHDVPWESADHPERSTNFHKLLKDDTQVFFLSSMLQGHRTDFEECHPVSEAIFRLSGSLLDRSGGLSLPGDYLHRPSGWWHGPIYSPDGTLSLVQCEGWPKIQTRSAQASAKGWFEGYLSPAVFNSQSVLEPPSG